MNLLYRSPAIPAAFPVNGNAGLWYDKFCNQWPQNPAEGLGAKEKGLWIATVARKGSLIGNADQLSETLERMSAFLSSHGQSPMIMSNPYIFTTGLGREHPVENGFAWHPTLGTPYLPGSSIKGMVRAWISQWVDPTPSSELINQIFGPTVPMAKADPGSGSVIFLDALPFKPVQLMADIMTPHYTPYYQSDENEVPEAPADWIDPTPIPFLSVAPEQRFIFGILPRRADDRSRSDAILAGQWIIAALENIGAGSKTAVGYGRFHLSEEAERDAQLLNKSRAEQLEKQRREIQIKTDLANQTAGKSEIFKEFFTIALSSNWLNPKGKDSFLQGGVIESWLDKLEKTPDKDLLDLVVQLTNLHLPNLLSNPELMGGKKKDRPEFKDRQKKIAYRIIALIKPK